MGRGSGSQALASATALAPRPSRILDGRDRYARFRDRNIRIHLAYTDEDVRKLAGELRRLAPTRVGLDFETASNRGYGVLNGSLRLIQIGIDEPERGLTPRQAIVDCFRGDPAPLRDLLADPDVELQVHNAPVDVAWSGVHLGVEPQGVYDTCAAWKAIGKKLEAMPLTDAQQIVPGWEPHDAKLGTLVRRYLHMEIPKTGQSSDWSRRWLEDDQMVYAAMDVAVMPELTEITKRVAERLGLTESLAANVQAAGKRAAGRHRKIMAEADDDSGRVRERLLRAASSSELDQLWALSRQMTLTAASRRDLGDLLDQQRQRLNDGDRPVITADPEPALPF